MRTLNNKNYRVDINKLLEYGFIKDNNIYRYNKIILNNEFKVLVEYKNDILTSKLIELSFDDEYLQADSITTGEYSNNIKNSYEEIINDIKNKCLIKNVYIGNQTIKIKNYIKNKYNCNIEYLWEKFDDNAVVRNNINNKWFGLFMNINASKLNIEEDKLVEILNLSYYKNRVDEVIDNKYIFPGYHMNKKSWITIVLNNSMDIDYIYKLIDISYEISITKK